MQIKQELPQFKDTKSLIISSGSLHALVFLACNSEIELIKEIEIEKIIYSDREGRFEKSGHGLNLGSGSVYEDDTKEERINNLLKEVDAFLTSQKEINKVFLFTPDYMSLKLEELIKKSFKLEKTFTGNFTDKHPFFYLEKIKEFYS